MAVGKKDVTDTQDDKAACLGKELPHHRRLIDDDPSLSWEMRPRTLQHGMGGSSPLHPQWAVGGIARCSHDSIGES